MEGYEGSWGVRRIPSFFIRLRSVFGCRPRILAAPREPLEPLQFRRRPRRKDAESKKLPQLGRHRPFVEHGQVSEVLPFDVAEGHAHAHSLVTVARDTASKCGKTAARSYSQRFIEGGKPCFRNP